MNNINKIKNHIKKHIRYRESFKIERDGISSMVALKGKKKYSITAMKMMIDMDLDKTSDEISKLITYFYDDGRLK